MYTDVRCMPRWSLNGHREQDGEHLLNLEVFRSSVSLWRKYYRKASTEKTTLSNPTWSKTCHIYRARCMFRSINLSLGIGWEKGRESIWYRRPAGEFNLVLCWCKRCCDFRCHMGFHQPWSYDLRWVLQHTQKSRASCITSEVVEERVLEFSSASGRVQFLFI